MYKAITRGNYQSLPLPSDISEAVQIVSAVFPFRTNRYVVDNLINWSRVPDDPIFQLTFPQRAMLTEDDYTHMADVIRTGDRGAVQRAATEIRMRHNPHPAGQMTHNVPTLEGLPLAGLQHKYHETVLYFPAQGQTCHAYCSYCFRWAQFIGDQDLKFAARSADQLVRYLQAHEEVTDVLFTGGDPAIMKTRLLRRHIEPLLTPELEHVQTIRLGTKALAYWPQRFVTDNDADDLLHLLEEIIATGRHVAIMAHVSHPIELEPPIAQQAIARLRDIGCEIRMQAPLMRHINDSAAAWAAIWQEGVRLGMVPYYMFVSRDTGPRGYFEVPLLRALEIFQGAYRRVSGLGRTVRGPVMSATPGKVHVQGVAEVEGRKVFVLSFLQGRNPEWVGRPFFAEFDETASWFFDLQPAFSEHFLHEEDPASRLGLTNPPLSLN